MTDWMNPALAMAYASGGDPLDLDVVQPEYRSAIKFVRDAKEEGANHATLLGQVEAEEESDPKFHMTMRALGQIDSEATVWALPGDEDQKPEEEDPKEATQATILLGIAEDAELFRDEYGRAFARIPRDGHPGPTHPVKSDDIKEWLSWIFYQRSGRPPGREALTSAITVMTAKAKFEGEARELAVRVARVGEHLWYDLARDDGAAVKIGAEGWDVVAQPPTVFRRYSHQQPQVEPLPGGSLDEIFEFLNIADNMKPLMRSWIPVALVPDIPRPALNSHGSKGSGKSFGQRVIHRLIDPSALETMTLVRNENELAQILDHHFLPTFDNIDHLSPRLADALCRAVTGAGLSKRTLYSDDGDHVFAFKRALMLNGISVVSQRSDWLDRSILLNHTRVPDAKRRTEGALWELFEERRPYLLGAIFDALSGAMAIFDSVTLDGHMRMADFARWGVAAAIANGDGEEAFLDSFEANRELQTFEAIEGDPVGLAIENLMKSEEIWTGTPSELYAELSERIVEMGDLRKNGSGKIDSKDWPATPSHLSGKLTELESNLAELGIYIERARRTAKNRTITISKISSATEDAIANGETEGGVEGSAPTEAETAVIAVTPSVTREGPTTLASDGDDGDDGEAQSGLGEPRMVTVLEIDLEDPS